MSDYIFNEISVQQIPQAGAMKVLLRTDCVHCETMIQTQSLHLALEIFKDVKAKNEFYKGFGFADRFMHSQICKKKLLEKMGDLCE